MAQTLQDLINQGLYQPSISPQKVNQFTPIVDTTKNIVTNTLGAFGGLVGGQGINSYGTGTSGTAQTTPQYMVNPTPIVTPQPVITQQNRPITPAAQTVVSNPTSTTGNTGTTGTGPVSTPTTIIPPPPVTTPGSVGSLQAETGYTQAEQAYIDSVNAENNRTATTAVDPTQIYQDNLKRYQAQIDANNALYNNILNESRIRNAPGYKARLDQNRIQQVQGGLVSSPMGEAQTTGINSANNQEQALAEAAINAEREKQYNAIMGTVQSNVTNDLANKLAAKKESTTAYLSYINAGPERRKTNLTNTIKKAVSLGYDVTKMTPDELKKLAGDLGVSTEAVTGEYNAQLATKTAETAKKAADLAKEQAATKETAARTEKLNTEIAQGKWITIGDGSKIYNPTTKQTIENPKTFKSTDQTANYTSVTIPQSIKNTLIKDAQAKDVTLAELSQAYPNVDTKYLSSLLTGFAQ